MQFPMLRYLAVNWFPRIPAHWEQNLQGKKEFLVYVYCLLNEEIYKSVDRDTKNSKSVTLYYNSAGSIFIHTEMFTSAVSCEAVILCL